MKNSSTFLLVFLGLWLFSACGRQKQPVLDTGLSNLENQVFTLAANQEAVIAGKEGSIFAIPAGAFLDEYGNAVTGEVEVSLKEARGLKAMFLSGLQTVSDQGILQTDGSYSIEASQNGKTLRLDPNVGIYAFFPTNSKDKDMKLWKGTTYDSQVGWTLDAEEESGIPECDASQASRKKCKKCEKLIKMSGRIQTGKKPKKDEYWVKRYYMENGTMYYFSSGSAEPMFKKKDLEECRKYLEATEKGRGLLAKVETIQKQQRDKASDYYSYRLDGLGWYNVDRLMKEAADKPLITFTGKVVDADGNGIAGAKVHFISKDRKIHVMQTSEDGSYKMQFLPDEKFSIYAYDNSRAGHEDFMIDAQKIELEPLTLSAFTPDEVESFLSDLN